MFCFDFGGYFGFLILGRLLLYVLIIGIMLECWFFGEKFWVGEFEILLIVVLFWLVMNIELRIFIGVLFMMFCKLMLSNWFLFRGGFLVKKRIYLKFLWLIFCK